MSTTPSQFASPYITSGISDVVAVVVLQDAVGGVARLGQRYGAPLGQTVAGDGSAVAEPKNVIVPIGISINEIIDFCGGFKSEPGKIIYGGPMMGVAVPDVDEPILKQTNAILAFNQKDSKQPKETACIQCGTCVNNCPFGINVTEIARANAKGEYDRFEKLGVGMCMECGCCAYNCPANRPLIQNNRLAKADFRAHKAEKSN